MNAYNRSTLLAPTSLIRREYKRSRIGLYSWRYTRPRLIFANGRVSIIFMLSTNGKQSSIDVTLVDDAYTKLKFEFDARHYDEARRAVNSALQFGVDRCFGVLFEELCFPYRLVGGKE